MWTVGHIYTRLLEDVAKMSLDNRILDHPLDQSEGILAHPPRDSSSSERLGEASQVIQQGSSSRSGALMALLPVREVTLGYLEVQRVKRPLNSESDAHNGSASLAANEAVYYSRPAELKS